MKSKIYGTYTKKSFACMKMIRMKMMKMRMKMKMMKMKSTKKIKIIVIKLENLEELLITIAIEYIMYQKYSNSNSQCRI